MEFYSPKEKVSVKENSARDDLVGLISTFLYTLLTLGGILF